MMASASVIAKKRSFAESYQPSEDAEVEPAIKRRKIDGNDTKEQQNAEKISTKQVMVLLLKA